MTVLATRLMTQPVTIVIRTEDGPLDPYGNREVTETPIETLCYAEQRSASEAGPQAQVLQARWRMTFPPQTPINGWARVELDGRSFEVIGFPWSVVNPRTLIVSHVEADLETSA